MVVPAVLGWEPQETQSGIKVDEKMLDQHNAAFLNEMGIEPVDDDDEKKCRVALVGVTAVTGDETGRTRGNGPAELSTAVATALHMFKKFAAGAEEVSLLEVAGPITITARTLTGQGPFEISLATKDSVSVLRTKVAEKMGQEPGQLRLICKGRQLIARFRQNRGWRNR